MSAIVITGLFAVPAGLTGEVTSVFISALGSSLVSVFGIATMAAAFNQLCDLKEVSDLNTDPDLAAQPTPV